VTKHCGWSCDIRGQHPESSWKCQTLEVGTCTCEGSDKVCITYRGKGLAIIEVDVFHHPVRDGVVPVRLRVTVQRELPQAWDDTEERGQRSEVAVDVELNTPHGRSKLEAADVSKLLTLVVGVGDPWPGATFASPVVVIDGDIQACYAWQFFKLDNVM
jgi:hypothetical protein